MSEAKSKFSDTFDPNIWSAIYDSAELNASQWGFRRAAELVRAECLLRKKPGNLWLDVGSGTGHLANEISSEEVKVVGVDHDQKMIIAARQRFSQLKLLQADAQELPFHSNGFDGIISVSVMGCFDSPQHFFKESYRVLRKTGFLIFTCTNRSSLLLRFNAALKKKPSEHFHLYSLSEVTKDLGQNGFELIDFRFYNFFISPFKNPFPPLGIAKFLERFGKSRFCNRLGRNFLIVAQKG